VKGPSPLVGREIRVPDLRAGFAYVMAGIIASENSVLHGLHFLERGYESLIDKLGSLGANVSKVFVPEEKPKQFDEHLVPRSSQEAFQSAAS
jgi:UDP-N-acetylglucosamine 1-carboxyvinyltransferase